MTQRVLFVLLFIITSASADAQYCLLPGRTPYSADQPGITNFKLNTINRTSGHVESMAKVVVVTTDTTVLQRGKKYGVSITHTRDAVVFPNARNNIRLWIDYNNNKSFDDAGEKVISVDYDTFGVFTDSFTVPLTAPLGKVRLRVTAKMSSDAGHSIPTPCDTPVADPIGYHGEIEDYDVRIVAAPTAAIESIPHASTAAIHPNPTNGQVTVTFDRISYEPISIDLLDVAGKHVGNLLHNEQQASGSYTFNLRDYISSGGVYLLKVTSPGSMSYQKVLISN